MDKLFNKEEEINSVENYKFEPIKGFPRLRWKGKRPFNGTSFFPAQLKERYGESEDGWINKIYWGDNLQVMSHLLKEFRGKINLIYIDPPFDSKADYKKKIKLKGKKVENTYNSFEEKQYTDIWTNDEYLQFMYERLILLRELLADNGSIYLHCDWRASSCLRLILDEIFGIENHLNEIIWCYKERETTTDKWNRKHDNIYYYAKSAGKHIFNSDDVREEYTEKTKAKFKYKDDKGFYQIRGKGIPGSPVNKADGLRPEHEKLYPGMTYRQYMKNGTLPRDWWVFPIINKAANERTDYPTQKPEKLLEKIIKASSNPGDIVFDCFMGSGTTQAVAMKLGRKFIGADINLGSIQTTTKRLLNILEKENGQIELQTEPEGVLYPGFEVYNVNKYDFFKNEVEAKELLIEALEIQEYEGTNVFDGEKDGRMVKIMPVNRLCTVADLEPLIANLDYKKYEKRATEDPNKSVESITLYCMGHDPELKGFLERELHPLNFDIEIYDILREKTELEFKRESEVDLEIKGGKLIINAFYPMNLLQKLSILKENVGNWRELVESIIIDWNYDGGVLEPAITDIPSKNDLVSGEYEIPKTAGTIKIKITDLLSESLEEVIENG